MKTLLILGMLTASIYGNYITAYWTGRSETFTTISGKPAVRCQYKAMGYEPIWRSFFGYNCPQSINLE